MDWKNLSIGEETIHLNSSMPKYLIWQCYNKLVLSWIYALFIEGMMAQIVGYSNAYEIWNAVNEIYALTSLVNCIELHGKLQQLRKDGLYCYGIYPKIERHLLCFSRDR